MARRGRWSSLRRIGTPAGGLALLCAALAIPAQGATPAPDPPPVAVAPEAPPVTRTQPPPVRSAPVVAAPAPVVRRAAPGVRAQPRQMPAAKPKQKARPARPARKAAAAKRPLAPAAATPHDRMPVPLADFVPTVEELNRGLAALAGAGLALVAFGGALVLVAARRELAR